MNAQLAKEIRCILPVWLMAIVAIGIAAIASSYFGGTRFLINPLCAVTVILLGASSFGCEFQYKTMPMLLSQPLIRAELWYSKMVILGPALLSLSAVAAAVAPYPDGSYLIKLVDRLAIAIMVFGLAPWLTLVARGGLVGAASVFLVCAVNEIIAKALLDPYAKLFLWWSVSSSCLLGILAYRRGYLTFLSWELIPVRRKKLIWFQRLWARLASIVCLDIKKRTASNALACKEIRLQAMSFAYLAIFCIGFGIVSLLLCILPDRLALLKNFVRVYCVTLPIIVGAISVARERNLGLLEWQLSFPIVAAKQWLIKLAVCLPLGIGGGFVLPWALLRMRGALPEWFAIGDYLVLSVLGTVIGICGSSLQQGTLKAVVVGIAAEFCLIFGSDMLRHLFVVHGMYGRFSSGIPLITNRFTLLGVMSFTLMGLLWLAYKNFLRAGATSRRIGSATSMALLIAVFLSVALLNAAPTASHDYAVPDQINDGWESGSLQSENLADGPITELLDRIADGTYKNTHSVLLTKNGKLVVEEYFSGYNSNGNFQKYDRDKLHELCSVSKSINSISIGIAIDKHLIRGVDEKISTLLPSYANIFAKSGKDAIRLVDLLTMRAGLSWDEWTYPYEDPHNDCFAMDNSKEPVEYVLARPLTNKPGAKFAYSTGITVALGEVVHQPSGEKADRFAEHFLFKPLGISKYYWSNDPRGFVRTGSGLALRPRDMAKIGQLFLDGGRWKGKQVVSEEWVKASTTNYVDAKEFPDWIAADGYGYQWWMRSFKVGDRVIPSFHAAGRGGQFIFVFPELKMVAVFTGWNDNELAKQPFDMVQRYIIPAATDQVP